jgi:hypothetical protein
MEAEEDEESGQGWMSRRGAITFRRSIFLENHFRRTRGMLGQWASDKESGEGAYQGEGKCMQGMVIL